MKDNTIDNQQAKAVDLAWLAGIVDGEGSILITKNGHKGNYKGHNMVVQFHITNTCGNIINKSQEIINSLGINCRVYARDYQGANKWKVCFRIDISRFKQLKVLLEALLPYLVSKDGQAKLVLRFIDRRLTKNRTPYEQEDIDIIDEYITKYRKGYLDKSIAKASETKREAPVTRVKTRTLKQGEDIVRPT